MRRPMMTANDLVAQIEAARKGPEQNVQTWLYPSAFFHPDIFVIAPNGAPTRVHPRECAQDLATVKLAAVLSSAGMACVPLKGKGFPSEVNGGESFTGKVGWLQITYLNGVLLENAGLVLDFFNHGISGANALANAMRDIAWDAFVVGMGPKPAFERQGLTSWRYGF